MSTWLSRLALIPKKTKVMLLSTPQMSKTHGVAGQYINPCTPCANGKVLTLMLTFCLFGLEVHENLNSKKIKKIKINTKSLIVSDPISDYLEKEFLGKQFAAPSFLKGV